MLKILFQSKVAKGELQILISLFHSVSKQICQWILLKLMLGCICSSFLVCSDYLVVHLALVFRWKNMNTVDEIYFCIHAPLKYFLTCMKKTRVRFLYRVNRMLLTCCYDCHKTVVKKHNSETRCFIRYFPEKEGP